MLALPSELKGSLLAEPSPLDVFERNEVSDQRYKSGTARFGAAERVYVGVIGGRIQFRQWRFAVARRLYSRGSGPA